MNTPSVVWQRRMMEHDPATCWCFVAPDRVCVRQRPCPLHDTPHRPLPRTAQECGA